MTKLLLRLRLRLLALWVNLYFPLPTLPTTASSAVFPALAIASCSRTAGNEDGANSAGTGKKKKNQKKKNQNAPPPTNNPNRPEAVIEIRTPLPNYPNRDGLIELPSGFFFPPPPPAGTQLSGPVFRPLPPAGTQLSGPVFRPPPPAGTLPSGYGFRPPPPVRTPPSGFGFVYPPPPPAGTPPSGFVFFFPPPPPAGTPPSGFGFVFPLPPPAGTNLNVPSASSALQTSTGPPFQQPPELTTAAPAPPPQKSNVDLIVALANATASFLTAQTNLLAAFMLSKSPSVCHWVFPVPICVLTLGIAWIIIILGLLWRSFSTLMNVTGDENPKAKILIFIGFVGMLLLASAPIVNSVLGFEFCTEYAPAPFPN